MIAVLNKYLVQHNSISIPGLGTIQVERIPASTDFVNKQLLPPALHYRFDKFFDSPDKDFFSYLATTKKIAEYEAIRLYNEWALNLRNRIREDEPVHWDGVGTLRKDVSGEILFEPVSISPPFLKPVRAERVIHSNALHTMIVGDKEVTNREMNEYLVEEVQVEKVHVEKESWWIYAMIIAAIAFIIIFFHFYKNGVRPESIGNQQTIRVAE